MGPEETCHSDTAYSCAYWNMKPFCSTSVVYGFTILFNQNLALALLSTLLRHHTQHAVAYELQCDGKVGVDDCIVQARHTNCQGGAYIIDVLPAT